MELPETYAIVLQQIDEDGEDDINNLVETLGIERAKLMHIVQSLQHKGLIAYGDDGRDSLWIRLSAKGRRLMKYIWPESGLQPAY